MDVTSFIAAYTSADEERIRFDWNGGHADEFVDRNMQFREAVREAVLLDTSNTPIELIRDLFRAETRCSREAWGIVDGVGDLAAALLTRGRFDYLDDYLEGKFQSFDASLGSAFSYDSALAQALLVEVRRRLRNAPDSPLVDLWTRGESLFTSWIADCERRPV